MIKKLKLNREIACSRVLATTIATSYLHAKNTPRNEITVINMVSKPKLAGEYIPRDTIVRKFITCATMEKDESDKTFFANSEPVSFNPIRKAVYFYKSKRILNSTGILESLVYYFVKDSMSKVGLYICLCSIS